MTAGRHLAALAQAGLQPADALAAYLDLLARWNQRINLTGLQTDAERVRVLVGEVAPAAPHVHGPRLLDLGSGNGSPGLVIALLRPDLEVVLVEPRQKRWAFLQEAQRVTGARRVEIVKGRHSDYRGAPADTVTLRALRLPMAEIRPLLNPDGQALLFGTPAADVEGMDVLDPIPLPSSQLHRYRRRA